MRINIVTAIPTPKPRGFAALKLRDPQRLREIQSRAGKAAHANGGAHEFTTEEAREAGRIGGSTVSQDRQHMKEIGAVGGSRSRGGGRRKATVSPLIHRNGERTVILTLTGPDAGVYGPHPAPCGFPHYLCVCGIDFTAAHDEIMRQFVERNLKLSNNVSIAVMKGLTEVPEQDEELQ